MRRLILIAALYLNEGPKLRLATESYAKAIQGDGIETHPWEGSVSVAVYARVPA